MKAGDTCQTGSERCPDFVTEVFGLRSKLFVRLQDFRVVALGHLLVQLCWHYLPSFSFSGITRCQFTASFSVYILFFQADSLIKTLN